MVMHTLSAEFTLLKVVNGETVAANSTEVTNGFVKPKLGNCHKSVGVLTRDMVGNYSTECC